MSILFGSQPFCLRTALLQTALLLIMLFCTVLVVLPQQGRRQHKWQSNPGRAETCILLTLSKQIILLSNRKKYTDHCWFHFFICSCLSTPYRSWTYLKTIMSRLPNPLGQRCFDFKIEYWFFHSNLSVSLKSLTRVASLLTSGLHCSPPLCHRLPLPLSTRLCPLLLQSSAFAWAGQSHIFVHGRNVSKNLVYQKSLSFFDK